MSREDEISRRILEGGAYERAKTTVRQTFDFSLARKVGIGIAGVLLGTLVGPAVLFRLELARSVDQGVPASGSYSPTLGIIVLLGVVVSFVASMLLIRQARIVNTRSLSESEAERLVRIEDLIMWFVLTGTAFVIIGIGLALVGVVLPGVVETLYEYGVVVYRPSEAVRIDVRIVSLLSAGLGVVLALTWATVPSNRGG